MAFRKIKVKVSLLFLLVNFSTLWVTICVCISLHLMNVIQTELRVKKVSTNSREENMARTEKGRSDKLGRKVAFILILLSHMPFLFISRPVH